MNRSATVLDQIRTRLMDEAEQAIVHAERYATSKRAGERHSVPTYLRRGLAAIEAVDLLDQVTI